MYHSIDYSRTKCRNTYTVKFKNSKGLISYGFVCWYVECCHDYNINKNNIFACISVLRKENRHIFDFYHLKIEADNRYQIKLFRFVFAKYSLHGKK